MTTDSWLILQNIKLHSGRLSDFKFECDNLTDEEIDGFARLIARMVGMFTDVIGIPQGGIRIATALEPFALPGLTRRRLLIVDDVLTEGSSMACERARAIATGWPIRDIQGAVMISRGACDPWSTPVLQLHPTLC
jgi:hypothetical protein